MNNFCFTGNLGRGCRSGSANGTAVVNFAVAVKSGYGQNEQTLWVDCALWGKQAESKLPEYLMKGQQVAVCGELGTREHEGKTYLTCRVGSISLIGAKRDDGQERAAQQAQAPQAPRQQAPGHQPAPQSFDDFDDDIPFN